jgi:hypothetical protein
VTLNSVRVGRYIAFINHFSTLSSIYSGALLRGVPPLLLLAEPLPQSDRLHQSPVKQDVEGPSSVLTLEQKILQAAAERHIHKARVVQDALLLNNLLVG